MSFDVRGYLESKPSRVKQATRGNVHMACPFCLEDESKRGRLYVQTEGDRAGCFTCFKCGERGGINKLREAFGDPRLDDDQIDEDWAAKKQKQRALNFACDYYAERLFESPEVMNYLRRERGLTDETIRDARLGFADGNLKLAMMDKGVSVDALKSVGLVYPDGRDFFLGYITIPYFTGGHVSLIRGRAFGETDSAKYKTPLGQHPSLYGSDLTYTTEGEITIVEGEIDSLVLRQLDIPAVACPGVTAWELKWADFFKEYRRIYVMFDPDQPGKIGAEKVAADLAPRARIVDLPPPDAAGTKFDVSELYVGQGWTKENFEDLLAKAKGGLMKTAQDAFDEWERMQTVSGLKTGFDHLDAILDPGLLGGQVFILGAGTGCLAGETELTLNRAGRGFRLTIKELYEKFHGRLDKGKGWDLSIPTQVSQGNFNEMIVHSSRISDVTYSGLKDTVVVTMVDHPNPKSIRLTRDHRVMTERGWREIGSLGPGDKLLVNAGTRKNAASPKKKPYYPATCGLLGHPRANYRRKYGWRVPRHIVVVEADMNGLTYEEYTERLRAGESDFKFVGVDQHVHHKDRDSTNYELSNLEVMSALVHQRHHGDHAHVAEKLKFRTIQSMTPGGQAMTFDISMAEGGPHFLAEGLVVHNSGKSIFLINLMHRVTALNQDAKVLFISLEQTEHEWFERARRIYRFYNPTKTDKDALTYWRERIWIVDENVLSDTKMREIIEQFALDVGQMPDLVLVDYLGYWARAFRGEAYERITAAVMSLKAMAKEFRVPVIAPHQISRSGGRGEEPSLTSLRDGGTVEETADFAALLWSPDQKHGRNSEDQTGERLMRLSKSRHGGVGQLFRFRFAPLSLVLIPEHEAGVELAKAEIGYSLMGDDFETSLWRHQTGITSADLSQFRDSDGKLLTLDQLNDDNDF